ncbi:HD domain-containing phosphohydrolase [Duganella aceris]|uniref:LuxR family transcriptional regulator n=1 Tax=Duganella aceris TaxID=2703883 RepID=A0ABX0FMW4_9BURK|nr:HD domain-containing phosphohydrolase [Duganella aceris]NGZ85861.1 LuxR family transcriptional regulator [Duganella aceris]
MYPATTASITDAMHTLAYVGDLSMGQPTDHSLRTAWLAARIAEAMGHSGADIAAVQQVALLRWSGCTANAAEFSALIGDDVGVRAKLLSQNPDDPELRRAGALVFPEMQPLSQIHCEVSGEIARMLQVPAEVEHALRAIFATYDGAGPNHAAQGGVPDSVYIVAMASDIEIFGREQGLPRALARIAHKSGKTYPPALADIAPRHAAGWLEQLDHDEDWHASLSFGALAGSDAVPLELLADVIDLKLPWMTGYSRSVAQTAHGAAAAMGMAAEAQLRCYRAGLVHGIGRAAVPNTVWNTIGRLSAAAREQLRLAPYWTCRAGARIGALAGDADIGSYAGERLDGSGAFRACGDTAIPLEGKIVAAATAWVALQSARPWRAAMSADEARALLQAEADAGRFDAAAVRAVSGAARPAEAPDKVLLTEREIEVFKGISLGQTNKEVARALAISPSTVRTHVENVFRKLGCTSRAAATLKASTLRLI